MSKILRGGKREDLTAEERRLIDLKLQSPSYCAEALVAISDELARELVRNAGYSAVLSDDVLVKKCLKSAMLKKGRVDKESSHGKK